MIIAQKVNLGQSESPADYLVNAAKAYIKTYTDQPPFYQPPNCSEVALYIGSHKPASMVFSDSDVKQAAFVMWVYDQRAGTYDDWYYALSKLIGGTQTSNITVAGYAVDLGLTYIQLNPYPGEIIDLPQSTWDAVKNFALSQVSYLNNLYGTTMVLTDTLFNSLVNQRGYFLAETTPEPEPEPKPEPETYTNLETLALCVEAGLRSAGIPLQAAINTDLTSAQWDAVSNVAFAQAPLLNNEYGTDLAITQSLIDNNLHMRKYWKAKTETEPEVKKFAIKNQMLMLVLFAGAFFLAIFPGSKGGAND